MKEKSLKKELGINLAIIAASAAAVSILLITGVFYRVFREEIFRDLKNCADVAAASGYTEISSDAIRITHISPDGNVLFDSQADAAEMGNHAYRPEVKAALKSGEGMDSRKSATLGKNMFYYAERLDDGSVLRVSKEAGSALGLLVSAIPVMLIAAAVILVMCIAAAFIITGRIVSPIDDVAEELDHPGYAHIYRELRPFIDTIRRQHDEIIRTSVMRQEFTANVSHELKTPLTSISGYSELIADGMAKDKDAVRFAGEIHRNADRLLSLINDIIKLSKLDSDDVRTESVKVNLYSVSEEIIKRLSFEAQEHQVSLALSGTDCIIEADRTMADEMIGNLCDNAIRYNKKGGRVDVSVEEMPEGSGYSAAVTVKDTGIGIAGEDQERIFERFYRVDKGRSRQTGGTGLGLAIVKHIAQKLDAKIELASVKGEGTKIRVLFR